MTTRQAPGPARVRALANATWLCPGETWRRQPRQVSTVSVAGDEVLTGVSRAFRSVAEVGRRRAPTSEGHYSNAGWLRSSIIQQPRYTTDHSRCCAQLNNGRRRGIRVSLLCAAVDCQDPGSGRLRNGTLRAPWV